MEQNSSNLLKVAADLPLPRAVEHSLLPEQLGLEQLQGPVLAACVQSNNPVCEELVLDLNVVTAARHPFLCLGSRLIAYAWNRRLSLRYTSIVVLGPDDLGSCERSGVTGVLEI